MNGSNEELRKSEKDSSSKKRMATKKQVINPGKVQPVFKTWLNREETLAYLGCADDYLRRIRDSGQISFAKDGKMVWYNVFSLMKYIEKHKVI